MMMLPSLMIFFSVLVSSGSLPSPQVHYEDVVGEPQVAVTDCECVLITLMDKNSGRFLRMFWKIYCLNLMLYLQGCILETALHLSRVSFGAMWHQQGICNSVMHSFFFLFKVLAQIRRSLLGQMGFTSLFKAAKANYWKNHNQPLKKTSKKNRVSLVNHLNLENTRVYIRVSISWTMKIVL